MPNNIRVEVLDEVTWQLYYSESMNTPQACTSGEVLDHSCWSDSQSSVSNLQAHEYHTS